GFEPLKTCTRQADKETGAYGANSSGPPFIGDDSHLAHRFTRGDFTDCLIDFSLGSYEGAQPATHQNKQGISELALFHQNLASIESDPIEFCFHAGERGLV